MLFAEQGLMVWVRAGNTYCGQALSGLPANNTGSVITGSSESKQK